MELEEERDSKRTVKFSGDLETDMSEKVVVVNSLGSLVRKQSIDDISMDLQAAQLGARLAKLKHYDDDEKSVLEKTEAQDLAPDELQIVVDALHNYVECTREDVLYLSVMNSHHASVRLVESNMARGMLALLAEEGFTPQEAKPAEFGFRPATYTTQ